MDLAVARTESLSSIVLAGGEAKRFGRNKLEEELGGRTLIQRVIDSLSQISDEIIVAAAPHQHTPHIHSTRVKVVTDLIPGKSALGGIYTGLSAAASFRSLVVAADMPLLNIALLKYMMDISEDYDVVVPRIDRWLEPLHAIYSKKCRAPMREQIESGQLAIRVFLEQVRVRYLEKEEIEKFDPEHLSFFNINTEADLDTARAVLARSQA